jgi:hypothetical protein
MAQLILSRSRKSPPCRSGLGAQVPELKIASVVRSLFDRLVELAGLSIPAPAIPFRKTT